MQAYNGRNIIRRSFKVARKMPYKLGIAGLSIYLAFSVACGDGINYLEMHTKPNAVPVFENREEEICYLHRIRGSYEKNIPELDTNGDTIVGPRDLAATINDSGDPEIRLLPDEEGNNDGKVSNKDMRDFVERESGGVTECF